MQDIINLEQLDYRDQLIKQYIDEHSGGGGGSSDYIPVTIAVQRTRDDEIWGDCHKMYIGVPTGTNVSDLTLTYVRHNSVHIRKPYDGSEYPVWVKYRYHGYHQVWAIPQKNKIPLFHFDFKNRTSPDYEYLGMDFYEIISIWDGDEYNMIDFINQGFTSGYKYVPPGQSYKKDVLVTDILHHKNGGLCLINGNGKLVSNVSYFRVEYSNEMGEYRLTTSRH